MSSIKQQRVFATPKRDAEVETKDAQRYLQRLCRHFNNKVSATWGEGYGTVHFAEGVCRMAADSESLYCFCEADSDKALKEIVETINSHFDRFKNNENLVLDWN